MSSVSSMMGHDLMSTTLLASCKHQDITLNNAKSCSVLE
jgi:hypothetical protein